MGHVVRKLFDIKTLLLPVLLSVFLVSSSLISFALFHSLAEFFAIVVAILASVVAWQMYGFTRNHFLMYLGCGYFWIASLDLVHALTYKGLSIIPSNIPDMTIQLWIGARYLEAFLLLTAPWFLVHSLKRNMTMLLFGFISVALMTVIMSGYFPIAFIEGQGLTKFKIYSEYVIIAVIATAIFYLFKQRHLTDDRIFVLMVVSMVLTMMAELAFTFYVSLYGLSNLAGHIFKLFSFWFIFVAVVRTTLRDPFSAMSKAETYYDAVPDATIIIDKDGIIQHVNQAACSIAEISSPDLIGKQSHNIFHNEKISYDDCKICQAIAEGTELSSYDMQIDDASWYDISTSLINEDNNYVEVIRDVSEKKRMLKESEELQKNYQFTLEQQVAERTTELETKAAELARATQLKSEFLANMSHELRTPMNSIIGFTARVIKKAGANLEERQLNSLRIVERNAHHLLDLINALLDLSKIEAGKMDAHVEAVDITSLAKEVFNLTQPLIDANDSVELLIDFPKDGITLSTDGTKLKQIMINLVSNAIKFTHKGSITISAELLSNGATEPEVKISIADTGVGMDPQALQYIFEAFRQVDGTLTRRAGGTGLGLAIVHSFVELLRGSITVESKEGEGTTFTIVLPVNFDATSASELAQTALLQVLEHSDNNDKPTILCIDDDDEALELISSYFREEAYQVVIANNAEDGLALAKKIKPFAITLDILMPGKDGWSVLSELKSLEATRDVPVFIISFLDNKTLGFQLGAFDYIQKPVNPERLIAGINRLKMVEIKKVLVVDDAADARDLMSQILTDEGIICETAVNGKDGLSVLERTSSELPGLILLDLMMPVMDGFEMLRHMQSNALWSNIPVIVVTAKTIEEHEYEYLRPRVASILAKDGLNSELVLKQLSTAIKRHL